MPGMERLPPESRAHPGELALGRLCDIGHMTAWKDVERAEPEFARRVRGLFDGHRHKTIATLRADGSPRISGIEAAFESGELAFGSMPNARNGSASSLSHSTTSTGTTKCASFSKSARAFRRMH